MRYTPSTDGLDPRIKKNLEDIARCIREFSANSSGISQKLVSVVGGSSGSIRHGDTEGRAERDQHPIKSISGLEEELSRAHMKYAGMEYPAPEWSLNGSAPNITMPAGKCNLYDNESWQGAIQPYDVPAANFTLTNGADQIVIVDYNDGSPCYKLELGSPRPWNFSNKIGVCRFWWDGVTIHSEPTDSLGAGLPEKEATRTALTRFYERALDSGLAIGVTSTPAPHTATLTEGYMFAGSILEHLGPFNSSTDLFTRYVKNSGVWTPASVTTFNSTNYNDNAGLVTASSGKYLVDWMYRSVGNIVQCFSVLGKTEFNSIADAKASPRRTDLPPVISKHCVLMGRYIVKVGASVGEVESVYTDVFSYGGITNHNDLTGIQDASPAVSGEHYHLSADQANHASQLAANWDMNFGSQQPATDNAVDVGYDGAVPKRVRNVYAMVLSAATGIYRAGLELASVFAPVSHASNSTTYGIADASNYGHVKSSTTNPLMDGVADPGTAGALVANYNHRHPTDTTREAVWGRTTITASSDLNNYRIPGTYAVSNAATATNMPSGAYGWGVLQVLPFSTGSIVQMYMPHRASTASTSGIWMRVCYTETWQDWQHIYGDAYNTTKYAQKEDPVFTGLMTAVNAYFSGDVTYEDAAAFAGFVDLRGELLLTGLQVSTGNADAKISSTASGFVNTATYTANRTVTLPVPKKGKILTLSNLGTATAYGMIIEPYSGTSIHYGITPTLVGGNANGIKSLILEGVSDTKWMVISMWTL